MHSSVLKTLLYYISDVNPELKNIGCKCENPTKCTCCLSFKVPVIGLEIEGNSCICQAIQISLTLQFNIKLTAYNKY